METINHEYYVSLEVAKLLKEAGFDWKCIYRYIKDTDLLVPCLGEANWNAAEWGINDYKSAPTLAVAQKWLRGVKDIEVNTLCVYIEHIKKYSYTVFTNEYEHEIIDEGFDTYEEAQEAGIKKALEMILEKGE